MSHQLPFSHDAFLDVFGAYNTALWPAEVALWLATAGVAIGLLLRNGLNIRAIRALLAVHWMWSGLAYRWVFFRPINPAAALFAVAFVLQGALFAWLAVTSAGRATVRVDARGVIGGGLVLCGLVYPFASLGFGLEYPRAPLFAVPCPTTLVTAGLLVTSAGVPRLANLVAMLWAIIGSSAAFELGIRTDLALVAAAAALAVDMLAPSALGCRSGSSHRHSRSSHTGSLDVSGRT